MLFMARTFWHAFWGSLPADPGWGSFASFREVRVEGPVLDIARILAISEVTVRRHISALLKKLEVSDREEAIRLIESDEG